MQWTLPYDSNWTRLSPYLDEGIFNIKFSHKPPQESMEAFLLFPGSSGYDLVE
jgi:hypothetical protein